MARNYIKDGNGNDVKNSNNERLFWSTSDGDSRPSTSQTVYREHKGILGGSSKVDSTYNPTTSKFNK
jgi:hypothetical protein